MTLNEIIKIVNGNSKLNSEKKIKDIKTDSRKINKGDLFIALKGKNYDGNDYIESAIKNGAIACITERDCNNKCIVVSDTNKSLYDIGKFMRKKYNIPLIAITGSNGKTTTKELLYHILSSKYSVLKNDGSKNNIIGVSDTLFKLNDDYQIIVMELGTNHMGEINHLSNMCNPTTAIITNIGSSHLEYFKNKRNIFKEKYSVINGMTNKNLIVNGDDKKLKKINCYKCGTKEDNDLTAYNIYENEESVSFCIYLDKEYRITFNNPGVHFINNILLAIKVSLDYGIDINDIIDKIGSFKIVDKRMNLIKLKNNILLNDCYNSSYESICAGINYLKNINGKKVLIIGDILELGRHSKRIHKKVNKKIHELYNYKVYTVGEFSKYIDGINFESSEKLIEYLNDEKTDDSYIYIKGSRRMNLEIVSDYIKEKEK